MEEIRYIVVGRFIDGSGGDVRRKVLLTVEDGIISAIASTTDLPEGCVSVTEDFSHCTIVPSFVDCSVALSCSPSVDEKQRLAASRDDQIQKARMVERHIGYCHSHGVLGVAGSDDSHSVVRHFTEDARRETPLCIRTSVALVEGMPDDTDTSLEGSDFLRICSSPDIEAQEASPLFSREELHRIIACSGEKKTVVVANGQQGVQEALDAGCDAIEQGYDMGEDNLRRMAENKVLWIPSVLRAKNALDGSASGGEVCCRFSLRYVAPGKAIPGAEEFWKKALARQLSQLRLARELGVATAVGTGAGSVGILHGESMVEEMKLFIKAGYSLEETIHCASEVGARFFGMENLGALAVGRRATFLITRGTVKQLPRKLSYLEGIYSNGAPSSYRKDPVKTVAKH